MRGLVEQRGDAKGLGVLLREELAQIGEGEAGIQNVLDDKHVLALNGLVEILDELDRAGGARALSIAGGGHEVEGGVGLYGAREVGQERRRSLEHAHHDQLLAVQVAGYLGAHLGDTFGNLLTGKENLEV